MSDYKKRRIILNVEKKIIPAVACFKAAITFSKRICPAPQSQNPAEQNAT